MYYRVKDPISAVANVDDYSGSARLLAATTLRNVLGTRNLGDILSERESIAQEMQVKFQSQVQCQQNKSKQFIDIESFKDCASENMYYPMKCRFLLCLKPHISVITRSSHCSQGCTSEGCSCS